jgi:hypothetical protein
VKRSRERQKRIVLLSVAAAAMVCTYLWASNYPKNLPLIALSNLIVGFFIGSLTRRELIRVSGWFVGSFLMTVGYLFSIGGGEVDAFALAWFITNFPFGLSVAGVGTLLGYFARPFVVRWLIRFSSPNEEDLYQGPRCVACSEPIDFGVLLCPKCGWTQPA